MRYKRLGLVLLLLLALFGATAAECSDGEYCPSGQSYEWRCSDELGTCVAVCR